VDAGMLKTLGQIGGIGGIALGIFLLLFRDIIRKSIFPKLDQADAFRLLRSITVMIWSIAVLGIGAWVWSSQKPSSAASVSTSGAQSPVIQNTQGGVNMNFGPAPAAPAK
jgi:nitrate reductase gamma subunit